MAFKISCPLCNSNNLNPVEKSLVYYKCKDCGVIVNRSYKTIPYNDKYFTDDYVNQYGKTYEEDFENIYQSSLQRLKKIQKLVKPSVDDKSPSVLDVGCALGFFLKAAEDMGYGHIHGIEISDFASNYARELFKYSIDSHSFDSYKEEKSYDLVSAWYFIEHTANPCETFQKLYSIVKEKGVLAFSLPSYFGPLYRFNRKKWVDTHPVDHLFDGSPGSIKKILKGIGFKKVVVYPGGIHPDRVFSRKSIFYRLFSKIYIFMAKKLSFSDTIEVYAVK